MKPLGRPLILASASPRRRELLTLAGFDFTIEPAHIDETIHPHESPKEYVQRLALEKARALHARFPDAIVLGADTTVAFGNTVLNKPADARDARNMLLTLSDNVHEVHTGIAVVGEGILRLRVETTRVYFAPIDPTDLETYIASGDPLDKAGAYGIQGFAARWIPRIEGDYFNVVGLPIAATVRLLRD
jgi:septum formation protein